MSEELFTEVLQVIIPFKMQSMIRFLPVPHYVLGDILMNERVSSLETALTQVASYGRTLLLVIHCWKALKRNMAEAQRN